MIRVWLAVAVALLFGSCNEKKDEKDSATADSDYSLATSDVAKAVSGSKLSGLEVTIKDGGDTVSGELATTDVALSISCSSKDKGNKISIDKVVKATDGVAKFGDIDLGGKMCFAGKYNCALSLAIKVDDELIKKKESFDVDIEKHARCSETATNGDQSTPAIGGDNLFEITGDTDDSVKLVKKADASGHCNALLLQEVSTAGELTGIKEQQIVIDSEGNASGLFIVGNIDNCELSVGGTVINKQLAGTTENSGAGVVKRSGNNVMVNIGSDPNAEADDPEVQALFISRGVTYVADGSPTNPSWSKVWQKSTAVGDDSMSWNNRPEDSGVAWFSEGESIRNNIAMAVIKVNGRWSAIGLIVPSAVLQIRGTMVGGREFAVEGRDGGKVELADSDGGSCAARLHQFKPSSGGNNRATFGLSINMSATGQANRLLIVGNASNCRLLVGVEEVSGFKNLTIPRRERDLVVSNNGTVSVDLDTAPVSTSSDIIELFVQKQIPSGWGTLVDGKRSNDPTLPSKSFTWGFNSYQNTYIGWGSITIRVRALIKIASGQWYSIGY